MVCKGAVIKSPPSEVVLAVQQRTAGARASGVTRAGQGKGTRTHVSGGFQERHGILVISFRIVPSLWCSGRGGSELGQVGVAGRYSRRRVPLIQDDCESSD